MRRLSSGKRKHLLALLKQRPRRHTSWMTRAMLSHLEAGMRDPAVLRKSAAFIFSLWKRHEARA